MSRLQILLIAFIAVLLLTFGAGAGAWYYLYGAPEISAAELVPANTLFFATIPNGVGIVEAYQTSQAKLLLSSPNMKPLQDEIMQGLGPKNADLLNTFLPNLSGQSFVAITQFDADHPENTGFIAAMKPKAGLGDFGAFLDKLKAAYPDLLKSATTGKGSVEGHDYDWIKFPDAPMKLCVANIKGWVVTTLGEAPLQDWVERLEKHATTSSLADSADYRSSIGRVGDAPMTLAYFNYHDLMGIVQTQMAKSNPALSKMLAEKLKDIGGAAVATRIENGQIVDRYSFLIPRQAQLEAGLSADPCAFDTLKFTSRNTRLYWASCFDWKQYYASLKEQLNAEAAPTPNLVPPALVPVQNWFRQNNLDVEHNIVEALGPEISVQAEWNEDMSFPEIGFFAKLDKPDDFKPVVSAVLDTIRKQFATSAVIKELSYNGQNFATLNFVQGSAISPTVTEDGPYFGLFLTANQAVRSYQRDPTLTLASNDSFKQQIGDQRTGAQQVIFLDTPYMLNRAYKLAVPWISMAAMFNQDVANALKGHQLPDDLTWLAPMGTWSCVFKNDDSGIQAYSISGVGNQGIFLSFLGGAGLGAAQAYGVLDKVAPFMPGVPNFGANPMAAPAPVPAPALPPLPAAAAPAPAPDQTNAPAATAPLPPVPPQAPAVPAPATNAPANATPPSSAPTP